MRLNQLSEKEESVIVHKGTEAPHSGEYDHFDREGVFTCRRCGAYLYRSEDKFDAHCGWPSFDDEVSGAVRRIPDADGSRTEILCARCDAHLGHVFLGERMTPKDTRHCVNSLSMRFLSEASAETRKHAYFGGGCFWCTEAAFKGVNGVISVVPGYAGGHVGHPTYDEVSSGMTGHAEVVKVEYDPTIVSYEALLSVFFASHDPTTPNRQGNDEGTQYRSVILHENDLDRELAESMIRNLEREAVFGVPIVTEVRPLVEFFEAEEYHHDYYEKHPEAAYCQAVIAPKLSKLRKTVSRFLKT